MLILEIIVVLALFVLNGFFAMAELADLDQALAAATTQPAAREAIAA